MNQEMNNQEMIDARIERIWKKMEQLPEELEFSCGEWPPQWDKPLPEERVAKWEEKHHLRLPADYRRFITTKTGSGTQPFYGLCNLMAKDLDEIEIGSPFPYTLDKPLMIFAMTDEELEAYFNDDEDEDEEEVIGGYIPLCTEGCGMDSVLVVNAKDEDTYGTVWFFDLANDCGIIPIRNQETGKPFCFLDWLEYWVDFTISHEPSEFFSYGELIEPFSEE